jgi:hypothetical protein
MGTGTSGARLPTIRYLVALDLGALWDRGVGLLLAGIIWLGPEMRGRSFTAAA